MVAKYIVKSKKAGLNSFQINFFGRLMKQGKDEKAIRNAVASAIAKFGEKVSKDLNEGLEKLSKVNTIVMDKTGTLTKGIPQVTDIIPLADLDQKEILKLLASLEENSEHPLSVAIVEKAKAEDIKFVLKF